MLTASDCRSVIWHDARYQRAIKLLQDDWQSVDTGNPLMSELIMITDLQFVQALQSAKLVPEKIDFVNYTAVMRFLNQHRRVLSTASQQWLTQNFK
ncbi:hypothetical protein [Secundilactobacillus collinoides]|uniref:Uncharacterized protein n=2 Tax=Secundilactobacillus collinoides TaxID=33960 RepID=A0A0R2BEB1_SECCO|nr:hypothetical protein [Secundilactobacillus collinoides]KRM77338.1 hypothetical protein FC82_GL000584 [Secundilactobacillus collinoides DSM 20515 = JCM 1123]KZL41172.1 hypothetical protein TY91_08050 [Secundilactobacillus collinoides]